MSPLQRFILAFGGTFVLAALLGFAASGTSMEAHHAARILGLFPVNLLHNLVHLVFGVTGLVAAFRWSWSRRYARISAAVYLVLVPLAIVSPTLGGLMPIGGSDVILHATLGAILGLIGFSADAPAERGVPLQASATA